MNRGDARGRRPLPQPTRKSGDGGRLSRGDDFDTAVGKVLDPTVEHEARGFFGRRGSVVNTLHAPRHDAAHRLSRARAQSSAASGSCVERNASTARFFARTAFMRAGP